MAGHDAHDGIIWFQFFQLHNTVIWCGLASASSYQMAVWSAQFVPTKIRAGPSLGVNVQAAMRGQGIGKGASESRDAEDPPELRIFADPDFATMDIAGARSMHVASCVCTACTALVACAPCITRACHLAGKLAQQLETPAGLWQPDGIDAARERLEALEQAEEAAAGLEVRVRVRVRVWVRVWV